MSPSRPVVCGTVLDMFIKRDYPRLASSALRRHHGKVNSRTGSGDDQEPVDIEIDRGADIDYLSTDPDDDPGRDPDDQAQPSGKHRGRAGWRSAIALLAVVLVAVAAIWWDGGQRSDGAAQVLAATAEGRADADHADAFISSTIVYASPRLESAEVGSDV